MVGVTGRVKLLDELLDCVVLLFLDAFGVTNADRNSNSQKQKKGCLEILLRVN